MITRTNEECNEGVEHVIIDNTPLPVTDPELVVIHNDLVTTNTILEDIDTDVEAINTTLTTTNSTLAEIALDTDNLLLIKTGVDLLHTDNGVIETKLDTLHTDNVTIEGELTTINTSVNTLLTQGELETELDEKFGDLGQKTMAGSAPVVIASDQTAIPVSLTSTTVTGTVAVTQSTSPWVVSGVTPSVSSTLSPTRFADLGSNATLNIKASAGNVYSLTCYNGNASFRYIQLHNTATVPGAGATPLYTFLIPTLSQVVIGTDFFSDNGANFSTGIAFAFSTTINTYTAGAAGDQSTIVMYI